MNGGEASGDIGPSYWEMLEYRMPVLVSVSVVFSYGYVLSVSVSVFFRLAVSKTSAVFSSEKFRKHLAGTDVFFSLFPYTLILRA